MILEVDYPIMFNHSSKQHQLFPRVFDGFLKSRIPGKNGEGTPRMMKSIYQTGEIQRSQGGPWSTEFLEGTFATPRKGAISFSHENSGAEDPPKPDLHGVFPSTPRP